MIKCILKERTTLEKADGSGSQTFNEGDELQFVQRGEKLVFLQSGDKYFAALTETFDSLFDWNIGMKGESKDETD